MLRRVVFIGVTGSCGKTTAKELIAAVLSTQFNGNKNRSTRNLPHHIASAVLRVRPWHKFHVQEIAAAVRGKKIPLERPLEIVRPQIGVVTNIGTDHISAFQTLEAIAVEKSKLVASLPQNGTAILNADDPNVLAMGASSAGRIITYGLARDAMLRAENINCNWPERLSFTAVYAGRSYAVHTQLCGTHWVPCVLAALATGLAMGVPLPRAAQKIQAIAPFRRRMCPITRQDGITFIQDDAKTPLWSIPPALQFMRDARVKRKIVVIGTISDYKGNSDRQYASLAKQALEMTDHVIFVGSRASKSLKARRSPTDDALQAFHSIDGAREYLCEVLRPGDLVLLKGTVDDHLEKLIVTREDVEEKPLRSPSLSPHTTLRPPRVVVGLGNPGVKYRGTPHNVGQRVVDLVARSLDGEWVREELAMVARLKFRETNVLLIKPLTHVNATGSVLLQLSRQLEFAADECILVQDDLDLPLGVVRVRITGSDGGHRGIRSVLAAFRTNSIRRVKIGVARRDQTDELADYVVSAFASTDIPLIEGAYAEAAERTVSLLEPRSA